MTNLVLHIGSNIENRIALLTRARLLLSARLGTIVDASPIYETAAWGKEEQADFLNQALIIESPITEPLRALEVCQEIETILGRKRSEKWGPRTIDIDIIFIEDQVIDTPNLTIPHPLYGQRKFVLKPLADIVPDLIPPDKDQTISELLTNCSDKGIVELL